MARDLLTVLYWGVDLGLKTSWDFLSELEWARMFRLSVAPEGGHVSLHESTCCVLAQWSWRHTEGEDVGRWFIAPYESMVKLTYLDDMHKMVRVPEPGPNWEPRLADFARQFGFPLEEPRWKLSVDFA